MAMANKRHVQIMVVEATKHWWNMLYIRVMHLVIFSTGLNLNNNDHYLVACSIFGRFRNFTAPTYGECVCARLFLYPISLSNCEYIRRAYDSMYLRSIEMKHQFITRASSVRFTVFFMLLFVFSWQCLIFSLFKSSGKPNGKRWFIRDSRYSFFFPFAETNAFQSIIIFFLRWC